MKKLRFDEMPDYAFLRKLFRDLFIREGYEYDCVFDWDIERRKRAEAERVLSSFLRRAPKDMRDFPS